MQELENLGQVAAVLKRRTTMTAAADYVISYIFGTDGVSQGIGQSLAFLDGYYVILIPVDDKERRGVVGKVGQGIYRLDLGRLGIVFAADVLAGVHLAFLNGETGFNPVLTQDFRIITQADGRE